MNDQLLHPTALAALYPEKTYPQGYPAYTRDDHQEALAAGATNCLNYWVWVHVQLEKEAS